MFNFFTKKSSGELLPLPYQTDIHSHIIPGVDDGAKDLESALFLAGKMHDWGIRHIITTPHRTDESFENTPLSVAPAFEALTEAINKSGMDLQLSHSFEYRLDEGFIRLKNEGKLVPLKGNHILVENSFIQPLWNLRELIFELKMMGLNPILAHPERYSYYFKNKAEYKALHEMELGFQVNLLSIAGAYGSEIQKLTLWMLDQGYLDYLSTDLHHKGHVDAIETYLRSSAYKKLLPRLNVKNDYL